MPFTQYVFSVFQEKHGGIETLYEYNEWLGGLTPDEWFQLAQDWQEKQAAKVKGVIL